MVKSSALAAIVTLLDLMGQTRFVFARTFDFTIYLYAALIYLAMTEMVSRLWNRLERGLSRHLARLPEGPALAGRRAEAGSHPPLLKAAHQGPAS